MREKVGVPENIVKIRRRLVNSTLGNLMKKCIYAGHTT